MKNNTKTIVILGGYGITGYMIARLLVQRTSAQLILAGRNEAKAKEAAAELNARSGSGRVEGQYADAAQTSTLIKVFARADLVVVASSTSQYTREIAAAALETATDYLDIQYSSHKLDVLKSLESAVLQAGRCFITDGGFHPGLAAVLVHQAADSLDHLETAEVGSVIRIDWPALNPTRATILELVDELKDFNAAYFSDGRWKKGGMRKMDFGHPFGVNRCTAMMLEEMRELPVRYPGLKETGFYVGGFNGFVDWVVIPLGMIAFRLFPRHASQWIGKWMHWGLLRFSKPPYGTVIKLEAKGVKNGRPAAFTGSLDHEDGYQLTAIPVAACLLQYLDGSIRRPGLHFQANLVQVGRLIEDMRLMGVTVSFSGD
ncbi:MULTISPECIES: saccharopine dehydrogenase family protein [Paenibacillus]|uniref:saccharopine dehydrogenase family protein n=1 Tax=Paenibacillus TaxID=44249 RepID=UPI002FE114C2